MKADTQTEAAVMAMLEQRGDRWLWVQMHASIPAEEQAEGESFPTA
jgi:hypothetical protein